MNLKVTIEYWLIERLVPYKRALRKNNQAVAQMEKSIQEFGFKIPVLALSSGEVIDGDLRLKAARNLKLSEVPVILCDDWSEAQVKAFRLQVNRSATWATFDLDMVALEMQELKAISFDLSLTGFNSLEIDRFLFQKAEDLGPLGPGGDGDPSIVTKVGDVWICCGHRILCGDATSKEAVATLLGPAKPALLLIDPPYGISYDPEWRERAGLGHQRQTGTVPNDDRVDWTEAYSLFPGDVAYVWHAGVHSAEVARNLEAAGFQIRSQIIWSKQHFALSHGDYHWQHEPCWYAVRKGKSSNWSGDRTKSTVWQVANLNPFGGNDQEEATGHGTQKPVEVMRRPILNNTRQGEIVYDCFLGSGTTLIAAELTDRICYGMDVDRHYVDVAVKRWQKLTGKQAILEGSGKTFDQIKAEGRSTEEVHAAA